MIKWKRKTSDGLQKAAKPLLEESSDRGAPSSDRAEALRGSQRKKVGTWRNYGVALSEINPSLPSIAQEDHSRTPSIESVCCSSVSRNSIVNLPPAAYSCRGLFDVHTYRSMPRRPFATLLYDQLCGIRRSRR